MAYLNREQILSADDLKAEDVDVPEWGGTARVRTMSGLDRDAFSASLAMGADGQLDTTNYRAKLVTHCVVDEAGNRLFSEEDVAALGQKSAIALSRVFAVAERLNVLSNAGLEATEKNSGAVPSDGSTSASA